MLYVLIGRDGPHGAALRPKLRGDHLAYLSELCRQGRVRLAGPMTDGSGSLVILDVPSEEEARRIAAGDPYARGGVFAEVEIHPFRRVLPETESDRETA
ncbi:MAG: hypothetical protein D6815_05435 [Candidatus Dadabacteria bacterium]|nr:MAG: hypothetical protein D6815_05435 [Candidatus Dadabacteria bacterium]